MKSCNSDIDEIKLLETVGSLGESSRQTVVHGPNKNIYRIRYYFQRILNWTRDYPACKDIEWNFFHLKCCLKPVEIERIVDISSTTNAFNQGFEMQFLQKQGTERKNFLIFSSLFTFHTGHNILPTFDVLLGNYLSCSWILLTLLCFD